MFALGVFLMVNVVVAFLMGPMVVRSMRKSGLATAAHNSKQLHLALFEFDQDYGFFPGDQAAEMEDGYPQHRGEYSNDYFKQLFENGNITSEENFYARGGSRDQRQPDGDVSSMDRAIEAGECGFAYVKNMDTSSYDPSTPLLLASMYGDGYKFNTDVYRGRAMVLSIDGSVKQYALNDDHEALADDGSELFGDRKNMTWGKTGFDPDHLCYAKYPYSFKPSSTRWLELFFGQYFGVLAMVLVVSFAVSIFAFALTRKWVETP